jgi:hypothetical protein
MKYCKNCKLSFDTDLKHCLFCNSELEQHGDKPIHKFPSYKKTSKRVKFYRFFVFLNIIAVFAALYIDYTHAFSLSWSLIVTISALYSIILTTILYMPSIWTSKLSKSIILTITALIFLGLALREFRWALDFVFPIGIILNIAILTILLLANKKKWADYAVNLFSISIVGLIPGILNLFNATGVVLPSAICFIYAVTTLIGMFFLSTKENRDEFKRRFHV